MKDIFIFSFFVKRKTNENYKLKRQMSKSKKKYYVVWVGAKPGVYEEWDEAKAQIQGYPAARYKSFPTQSEAEKAFRSGPEPIAYTRKKESTPNKASRSGIVQNSISVDAACSGNPGDMEYRGVWTTSGEEIFRVGPLKDGTNNIGEFLALVHILALLKKYGKPNFPIYSDSKIAIGWVQKGKCNTKLEATGRNAEIFDMISRAEAWLKNNKVTNPILKWETKSWGEIPADFGRK